MLQSMRQKLQSASMPSSAEDVSGLRMCLLEQSLIYLIVLHSYACTCSERRAQSAVSVCEVCWTIARALINVCRGRFRAIAAL